MTAAVGVEVTACPAVPTSLVDVGEAGTAAITLQAAAVSAMNVEEEAGLENAAAADVGRRVRPAVPTTTDVVDEAGPTDQPMEAAAAGSMKAGQDTVGWTAAAAYVTMSACTAVLTTHVVRQDQQTLLWKQQQHAKP